MTGTEQLFTPTEAARRLGVSIKALRLYERHGLIAPQRNISGWRFYGPEAMERGRGSSSSVDLGMSLKDIGAVLAGAWTGSMRFLPRTRPGSRPVDHAVAAPCRAQAPARGDGGGADARDAAYAEALRPGPASPSMPWPWGGEDFALPALGPLTWLTGPWAAARPGSPGRWPRRWAAFSPGSSA